MRTQKRRVERTTLLVYGEGSSEEAWLKYIKHTFANNKSGIAIKNGGGGSPLSILIEMQKNISFLAYDKRYILVDSDRGEIEDLQREAKRVGVEIIVSEQCLEVELLRLLNISKNVLKRINGNSSLAKAQFATRMRHGEEFYKKHLPKNKLMVARRQNKWLDAIISIFE